MKNWILAARPKTLFASIAPVILGVALAISDGFFNLNIAIVILFTALMIQIGANLANDYFDFMNGADNEKRVGPVRVMQKGLINVVSMKRAISYVFSMAIFGSCYLILKGGYPIGIIAATSVLFAILYTGGPKPLGYMGLGDLLVLIYFGPVAVCGTYYLLTSTFSWPVFIASFIPSLFSVGILTVNNLRDYETDKAANKRTLCVRFGQKFAQLEYMLCMFLVFLIPVILVALTKKHLLSLSAYIALPLLKPCLDAVKDNNDPKRLNSALAQTAAALMLFVLIFSTGWLL